MPYRQISIQGTAILETGPFLPKDVPVDGQRSMDQPGNGTGIQSFNKYLHFIQLFLHFQNTSASIGGDCYLPMMEQCLSYYKRIFEP